MRNNEPSESEEQNVITSPTKLDIGVGMELTPTIEMQNLL